jgi:DNA-binding MarR family transcriptional regulator
MATPNSQKLLMQVALANHKIFMVTSGRIEAALVELRLTYQTAHALMAIDPSEAPPSMSVMAERLYCNAPNLTFIAKQLETRGYVTRMKDVGDKRSNVLRLTPEGARARAAVVRATLAVTPFADCDVDELHDLARLFARIG